MADKKPDIFIRDHVAADIPSMATIISRAYAPDAHLLQIIPDTPTTRTWWAQTFEAALTDPAARILVAVDQSTSITAGVFTMHYLGPESPANATAGVVSAIPLTLDHSQDLAEAIVKLKQERVEFMGNEPHYLIELVGVDDEYKSHGIGRQLTQRACDIADEHDAAIFLQTSAARQYYVDKLNMHFKAVRTEEGDAIGGTIVRARKSRR